LLPSDYSARKDEWKPPPPPPPPPKPEEKVSTNGKCGTRAQPYKARCPDNFCCTYPSKLCRESGKACSTTGVNKNNAKYHGKRTKFWSSKPAPTTVKAEKKKEEGCTGFACFLPQDNTMYASTNLKCGTDGSPSPGYCPKGRCCSDKLVNMCVPTNTMQQFCTPGHANRKYDYPWKD
jgi:hypothetical protein